MDLLEILDIFSQTLFSGNDYLTGLMLLIGIWLVLAVIMANMKAPITYTLVPLIPLAVIFSYLGLLSIDVAFLIILLSAVITAMSFRRLTTGD